MIYEKKCLFLFKSDIKPGLECKIKNLGISDFVKDDMDINMFRKRIENSLLIVYVDGDRREMKFLQSNEHPQNYISSY